MKNQHQAVKKLAMAGILTAVAVIGGTLSIPVGFTRCCPMQSIVNVISGIFLGPWYSLGMAFCTSVIRNVLGTGTIMAFPGSMCGALLAGLLYRWKPKLYMACLGEIVGTGVISAFLAWPIAIFVLGKACGPLTYFAPFMIVAVTGSAIALVLVFVLSKTGAMRAMERLAEKN